MKILLDILRNIKYLLITIFLSLVFSVFGYGSISLIYILNKPLGIYYSIFASYAVTGLLGWLMGIYITSNMQESNKTIKGGKNNLAHN